MTKDLVTPVSVEEINAVVKNCLEKAALINYTKMSEIAKIEGRLRLLDFYGYSTPVGERTIVISVTVSLCVCKAAGHYLRLCCNRLLC